MPLPDLVVDLACDLAACDVVLGTALRVLDEDVEVGLVLQGVTAPGSAQIASVIERCAALAGEGTLPRLTILGSDEPDVRAAPMRVSATADGQPALDAISALVALAHSRRAVSRRERTAVRLRCARDAVVRARDDVRGPAGERPLIVVLAQVQSTWTAVGPVVTELAARDDVNVEIVAMDSQHEGAASSTADFIRALGHTPRDLTWFEEALDDTTGPLSLVLSYDPWDGLRPVSGRAITIANKGVRLAYIPYGTNVGAGTSAESYAYDLPIHRLATRVYARSRVQRDMFADFCAAGNDHVRVMGVPKFDRARTASDSPVCGSVVIWNPHFSLGTDGWSTFAQYLEPILEYARTHQDFKLIVRPHFRILRDAPLAGGGSLRLVDKLKTAAEELQNVEIDTSTDYIQTFGRATAMISDLSSLATEFLTTGKPLLYLHRGDSPGVNRDAQYFFEVPTALEWRAVERFLDDARLREDTDAPRRRLLLARHFEHLDGNSAARIADDLISILPGSAT